MYFQLLKQARKRSKRVPTTTTTTIARAKIPKFSAAELTDRKHHDFENKHRVSPKERHGKGALPPIPQGKASCKDIDLGRVVMSGPSSEIYKDTSVHGQHYCHIKYAEADSLLPQGQLPATTALSTLSAA